MITSSRKDTQNIKLNIVVPELVFALVRDPYDYVFWVTVRRICDDVGDCHQSNETLAKLSMMSVGKVVQCRNYLISIGLLAGEIQKADYGQGHFSNPMWLLWIPDLKQRNIEWCIAHPSATDWIEWKKSQKPTN